MTFDEYAKVHHEIPYIFEIANCDKRLVYFGARHTNDSADPEFEQIEQKLTELKPQLVLVEGRRQLSDQKEKVLEYLKSKDRNKIIKDGGEPDFTIKLAAEARVDVESPEPKLSDEINDLIEHSFDKYDIFAFYIYRGMSGYNVPSDSDLFDKYLKSWINYFKTATNWGGFDYSTANIERAGKKIWGDKVKLSDSDQSRFDPVFARSNTISNKIAIQSSLFRDKFITQQIAEAMKNYDRIFIVYGASHAVMQEPALRAIINTMNRFASPDRISSSQNFDYEYFGDYDTQQMTSFAEVQESDLQKILAFLSVETPKTKYIYKIFPTLIEKQQADPNHSVSHACARVEKRAIYRVLGPEMEVLSFPHELVHLVAHDISSHYKWRIELDTFDGGKQETILEMSSTSFLQEGLAILIDELVFGNKLREAGEYRFIDEWVRYNQDKNDLKPHDLFEIHKSSEQSPLFATPICASFCKFLVEKYGLEKFMVVYKISSELNSEDKNIKIIEDEYQKSIKSLEKKWRFKVLA